MAKYEVIDGKGIIPEGTSVIERAAFVERKDMVHISIPDSVTSIGNEAFLECSNLTRIEIPDSVIEIGSRAFEGCECLSEIILPPSVEIMPDTVETDDYDLSMDLTFYGCKSLTSIRLPETITKIGGGSFEGCESLTEIEIPEGVDTIGNGAFSGCTSLKNIKLPESLRVIRAGAFSGCISLTEVVIPDGVEIIPYSAFFGCTGLASVVIPKSVRIIRENAFKGCVSLEKVEFMDSSKVGVPVILQDAFDGCPNLIEDTVRSLEQRRPRAVMKGIGIYDNLDEGDFDTIIELFQAILASRDKNDFEKCVGMAVILDSQPEIDKVFLRSIHDSVDKVVEEEMLLKWDHCSREEGEYTEISLIGDDHNCYFRLND